MDGVERLSEKTFAGFTPLRNRLRRCFQKDGTNPLIARRRARPRRRRRQPSWRSPHSSLTRCELGTRGTPKARALPPARLHRRHPAAWRPASAPTPATRTMGLSQWRLRRRRASQPTSRSGRASQDERPGAQSRRSAGLTRHRWTRWTRWIARTCKAPTAWWLIWPAVASRQRPPASRPSLPATRLRPEEIPCRCGRAAPRTTHHRQCGRRQW